MLCHLHQCGGNKVYWQSSIHAGIHGRHHQSKPSDQVAILGYVWRKEEQRSSSNWSNWLVKDQTKFVDPLFNMKVGGFQSKSHSLTAIQPNLKGSPFYYVNIYRCQSNGASDTDFLSPRKKAMWCWEQSPNYIVLTTEIFMRLNHTHTIYVSKGWWHQASIKVVSDLEIAHLPTVGVAYKRFHWATPTCSQVVRPGIPSDMVIILALNRRLLNTLDY